MHPLDAFCESLRQEFDSAVESEKNSERAALTSSLNQFLRRLRAYRGQGEWASIVLDGLGLFSTQIGILTLANGTFRLGNVRGLHLPEDFSFVEPFPRAISSVLESKETVITLRTQAEIGAELASPGNERALLLPIINAERVVAIAIIIGANERTAPALELITNMAGIVLERSSNKSHNVTIEAAPAALPGPAAAPRSLPRWAELSEEVRAVHIKAQRFARTRIAEMQLNHSDAAQAGRQQSNLYLFLKQPIDAARELYLSQFMRDRSMVDYLHLELIGTLAEGDEDRLGDEYPGPLQ
jgi:hypothetical protein